LINDFKTGVEVEAINVSYFMRLQIMYQLNNGL